MSVSFAEMSLIPVAINSYDPMFSTPCQLVRTGEKEIEPVSFQSNLLLNILEICEIWSRSNKKS